MQPVGQGLRRRCSKKQRYPSLGLVWRGEAPRCGRRPRLCRAARQLQLPAERQTSKGNGRDAHHRAAEERQQLADRSLDVEQGLAHQAGSASVSVIGIMVEPCNQQEKAVATNHRNIQNCRSDT